MGKHADRGIAVEVTEGPSLSWRTKMWRPRKPGSLPLGVHVAPRNIPCRQESFNRIFEKLCRCVQPHLTSPPLTALHQETLAPADSTPACTGSTTGSTTCSKTPSSLSCHRRGCPSGYPSSTTGSTAWSETAGSTDRLSSDYTTGSQSS